MGMHDFPIFDQLGLLRDASDGGFLAFSLFAVLLTVLTLVALAAIWRRDP